MNKQLGIQQICLTFFGAVLLSLVPLLGSTLSVMILHDIFTSTVSTESLIANYSPSNIGEGQTLRVEETGNREQRVYLIN